VRWEFVLLPGGSSLLSKLAMHIWWASWAHLALGLMWVAQGVLTWRLKHGGRTGVTWVPGGSYLEPGARVDLGRPARHEIAASRSRRVGTDWSGAALLWLPESS